MSQYKVSNEFLVMPADTNDLYPLIYGRQLWGEMDKAAAIVSRKYLEDTVLTHAVTHCADVKFKAPSYSGDVLKIVADVTSANHKSIVIRVDVWRGATHIAEGKFVFVAIQNVGLIGQRKPQYLEYADHGKPFNNT